MSTGGDFQSLPPAIIRAIAMFCKPDEVCSLGATCRRIQENLRISIIDPPFAKWRRRVVYTSPPVQEIMRIPTFFHDRPYYARLVLGIDTIQQWGPSTRFFLVSKPGTIDETTKVRDSDGNEGTFIVRVPSSCNRDNRVEILVEPNQTYFLWGENKENTSAQITLEAARFLVFDTNTFCLKQVYTKAKELEQSVMQKLHPFEAKHPTVGAYKSPGPYFFSNIFSMVLDTSNMCSMQRLFWSDAGRHIDMDIYQELKAFLRTCDQVMRSSKSSVGNDHLVLPCHSVGKSLCTLPPIRFVVDAVGWARYQVVAKPLLRIPVFPNTKRVRINARFHVPGTIQLKCVVLKHDTMVGKTMIPTDVVESEDTKDKLFLVSYDFELYPNTASCLLEFEPGSDQDYLKDLEMYLTVEKEEGDLLLSSSFMEERLCTFRDHRNTLPCWQPFSRLLHVFSAAVTFALMERQGQGQGCKGMKSFLEEEGFPTTSEGLASLVDLISAIFWM